MVAFRFVTYFYSQDGACLINFSDEVYIENELGFSNNGGFVCKHFTVAKPYGLEQNLMAVTASFPLPINPLSKPFVKAHFNRSIAVENWGATRD